MNHRRPPRAHARRPLTVPLEPPGNRVTIHTQALLAALGAHRASTHDAQAAPDCGTCTCYVAAVMASRADNPTPQASP